MRKHFLLLFLMALLPLASFAATYTNVDISTADVVITLQTSSPVYNNAVQTPTITKVEVNGVEYTSELTQFFTPKYYKKNASNNWIPQNADQIQDAGEYAVAIFANGAIDAERELQYTANKESNVTDWAFYTIQKKNLNVTLANGTKQYGGTDPTELDVTPVNLPSGWTAPEFTWTGTLPIEGAHANVNAEGYSYNFPQNTLTGQTYVSSVNYNVFITNQPKLIVTKKAITLNYKGAAPQPSKVYGVETLNDEFLTGIKAVGNYENVTPLEGSDELATVLAGITADGKVTTTFNYAGTPAKESANAQPDGTPFTDPAEHKLTITIDANVATNYTFTVNQVSLKVKQATLSAATTAPFTFEKVETAPFTYNSQDQNMTKTVTYTANNEKLLADGADPAVAPQVEVTYKVKPLDQTTVATVAATHTTDAGIYEAYIAPTGNTGNFYTESYAPIRLTAFDFRINKKPMYVYVTEGNITKVYKGSAYDLATETHITFQGLTTTDAATTAITNAKNAVKVKVVDNSTNPATITSETTVTNADAYTITPDVTVADAAALHVNYDVEAYESTFTVSPLAITIDPKDMNADYGTAIAGTYPADATAGTGNVTVTKVNDSDPAIKAADQALVLQAYNVVVADKTYAAGTPYPGAITLAKKALVSPTDDAIIEMLKNFTINDEGTGDVTIGQGSYTIVAKDKNKTYGETYTWDLFDYLTPGLTGTTQLDPANVKFILVDNSVTPAVTYSEYAGDVLPKNAGTYTIKVDAEHSNLTITNYGAPTLNDGELTIAPKALKAVLDDQTLMVGDTKAALAKSMVKFVEVPVAATPVEGVVGDDVIGFALDFNVGAGTNQIHEDTYSTEEADAYNKTLTGAINYAAYTVGVSFTAAQVTEYNTKIHPTIDVTTADVIENAHITAIKYYNAGLTGAIEGTTAAAQGYSRITKKLTLGSSVIAEGIKIVEDNTVANNANANYDIDWTGTAQLTVLVNTKLDLASNDNDLSNIEKIAASHPSTTVPVTLDLSKRTVASPAAKWDAQKWNTLVLPFDIEVADLSRIFGYAIVNVLDKANTTGKKVAFKIEMGTIPANTPFTIKTTKKLIGENTTVAITTDGKINFGNQLVKAPTAEQIAGADAGNGCKFVPAYQTKTIDNTMPDLLFLMGDRDKWIYVQNATTKWNVVPFAAYMDLTNAGVGAREMIFTFQEADGSTTAIKAVDMDFVGSEKGYTVDGWYTLNGVKLQGAPTEKGVYINNGKKVVIK